MIRRILATAMFLLILLTGALSAQAPSGLLTRLDRSRSATDPDDVPDVTIVSADRGFQVNTGSASTGNPNPRGKSASTGFPGRYLDGRHCRVDSVRPDPCEHSGPCTPTPSSDRSSSVAIDFIYTTGQIFEHGAWTLGVWTGRFRSRSRFTWCLAEKCSASPIRSASRDCPQKEGNSGVIPCPESTLHPAAGDSGHCACPVDLALCGEYPQRARRQAAPRNPPLRRVCSFLHGRCKGWRHRVTCFISV